MPAPPSESTGSTRCDQGRRWALVAGGPGPKRKRAGDLPARHVVRCASPVAGVSPRGTASGAVDRGAGDRLDVGRVEAEVFDRQFERQGFDLADRAVVERAFGDGVTEICKSGNRRSFRVFFGFCSTSRGSVPVSSSLHGSI